MAKAPAWFVAAVDQRLGLIKEAMGEPGSDLGSMGVVMTYLKEAPEGSTEAEVERFDRTCDNCGAYCAPQAEGEGEPPFFTGNPAFMLDDVQVIIAFGVCGECAKEFPQ